MKRWKAIVRYRSDAAGIVDVTHEFEELDELHNLVELGPDWATIIDITITYQSQRAPLTIEAAERE